MITNTQKRYTLILEGCPVKSISAFSLFDAANRLGFVIYNKECKYHHDQFIEYLSITDIDELYTTCLGDDLELYEDNDE